MTVRFRVTKEEASELKKEFPSTTYENGFGQIKIEARTPKEMISQTKRLLEKVRTPRRP